MLLIEAAVGAVLATVWLTCWLLFARLACAPRLRPVLQGLHRATALLPFAWVVLAATLLARAYLRLGEWPHGGDYVHTGNVFPEWREGNLDASTLGLQFDLVLPLGLGALAACLFFPPLHVALSRASTRGLGAGMIAFAIGAPLFVLFGLTDFGGVREWLDG